MAMRSTAPLFACLLLAMPQARAVQADTGFTGLPAGGGLDAQGVIEQRYGKQAAQASGAADTAAPKPAATEGTPAKAAPPDGGRAPTAAATPAAPARAAMPGALATLWLERTDSASGDGPVPVTFGQVFAPGALARNAALALRLADGSTAPLQMDVKALHADGSIRHAILSAIVPMPGARPLALGIVEREARRGAGDAGAAGATPAMLLKAGLSASVRLTLDGAVYGAALERLLAASKPMTWLAGPVAHEWHASAPLSTADGRAHPHLAARFAVRWYPQAKRARVDVTIENNWAYEAAPQNFTYDAEIMVGKATVYRKSALTHYHHARWRTLAWWGGEPGVYLRHDSRQLIATRALPNYDPALQISDSALATQFAGWNGPRTEPMGVGMALPGMPTTGGRPDIGLLPGWAATYLIGMDPRAATMTMRTADLAGSWSIHYRDRGTGRPISIMDYPYMTLVGRPSDTHNPATRKSEAFPACAGPDACRTPNNHDSAHQPNFSYLPYLLSGDYYHLEELQFWAMLGAFASNPGYRQHKKGLVQSDQVRGQAWVLRTLAQTAYITPDNDPLKSHFLRILDSNLDWYIAEYPANPKANRLGIIAHGGAIAYNKGTGIAPWQDDFFTAAIGHAAELGFPKAARLLTWKAAFPVARMIGPGSCWIDAAMYAMKVRDNPNAPVYATIGEAFRASTPPAVAGLDCGSAAMASALKLRPGEMTGYATSTAGYPSNLQPALAYAADALGKPGRQAWERFINRSVKPNYGAAPQFAIVPRGD